MKKFIKDKRRKASEERKAQQEDSRRKKIQVQERLLALDAFRKTQVKLKSEMVSEASGRQKLGSQKCLNIFLGYNGKNQSTKYFRCGLETS